MTNSSSKKTARSLPKKKLTRASEPPTARKHLQANILKFHGRRHGAYLFLGFKEEQRTSVQESLANTLEKYVTSAADQEAASEIFSKYKKQLEAAQESDSKPLPKRPDTRNIVTFGLSWKGYTYLGLSDYLPGHGTEENLDIEWFQAGLRDIPKDLKYQLLWDPQKQNWDPEYRDNEVHAIFILADDNYKRLQRTAQAIKKSMGKGIRVVAHENVRLRVWPKHDYGEHFGFRDTISKVAHPEEALVREPALKTPDYDKKEGSWGSFLAVVKLEQNVQKFRNDAEALASRFRNAGVANVSGQDAEALAVGRRPNGVSLIEFPLGGTDPKVPGDKLDAFDFKTDPTGTRCPFHAHIRKMNSRGTDPRTNVERTASILRRGMAYGLERQDILREIDQIAPSSGVGLMFTSFQRNLVQLIALFHRAYDPKDLDSLIGRTLGRQVQPQMWEQHNSRIQYLMADFVTPKGGGYFFAPSMHLIRNLKKLYPSS